MEPLESPSIRVAVKEIASRSTLRLTVTIGSDPEGAADREQFVAWFDRFYAHVETHKRPFCVIYVVPSAVEHPEDIKFYVDVLNRKRHLTRQYSVTTCVVASGVVGMVANLAIGMYGSQGTIHFTETLDAAKELCREAAYQTTRGA